jgi:hypothetical protein
VSVYVDDWRQLATVGHMTSRWSHMTADSTEELHELAARLGIPRRAFQQKRSNPVYDHYDLTEELRERAISIGAVAVSWREAAKLRRERLSREGPSPVSPPARPADDHRSPG